MVNAHSQRGMVLGSTLLLLVLVLLTIFILPLLHHLTALARARQLNTHQALATAKSALLGYAQSYASRQTEPGYWGRNNGYLPCPDTDNDGYENRLNTYQNNASLGHCGGRDLVAIGRLPWKTLGLAPLRDGSYECLWYIVSGAYKGVEYDSLSDSLSWESNGQIFLGNAPSGYAAVVLAPHYPFVHQQRSASLQNCQQKQNDNRLLQSLPAYLDRNIAFRTATLTTVTDITSLTLAQRQTLTATLTPREPSHTDHNDSALGIQPKEIWQPLQHTSEFTQQIQSLLLSVAECMASAPADNFYASERQLSYHQGYYLQDKQVLPPLHVWDDGWFNGQAPYLNTPFATPLPATPDWCTSPNAAHSWQQRWPTLWQRQFKTSTLSSAKFYSRGDFFYKNWRKHIGYRQFTPPRFSTINGEFWYCEGEKACEVLANRTVSCDAWLLFSEQMFNSAQLSALQSPLVSTRQYHPQQTTPIVACIHRTP